MNTMMRTIGILSLISLGVLGVLLLTTNPSTISPLGILFVFLLLYTSTLGVLTYFLYFGSRSIRHFTRVLTGRAVRVMTGREAYLFGSVLAIAPIILLAMLSVDAMTLTDVSLVIVFEVLACFYIWRRI